MSEEEKNPPSNNLLFPKTYPELFAGKSRKLFFVWLLLCVPCFFGMIHFHRGGWLYVFCETIINLFIARLLWPIVVYISKLPPFRFIGSKLVWALDKLATFGRKE